MCIRDRSTGERNHLFPFLMTKFKCNFVKVSTFSQEMCCLKIRKSNYYVLNRTYDFKLREELRHNRSCIMGDRACIIKRV
mgnify:CR=1 FL=1